MAPLRVALVGCGTVALGQHLPGYRALGRDRVDVTVFQSRSPASAEAARLAWGSGETVPDWRQAILRDDVDAVDVCTPNALHAEIAVAAARAGRHVLVEKPLATTLDDAERMLAAAAAARTVLMTAHNGRYAPAIRAARAAVAAGRVGEVTAVEAWLGHGGPEGWAPRATWFLAPETAGGGALIDLGVHLVDNVRYVTGDEFAVVAAMRSDRQGGVERNGHVLFRLERGAVGSLKASWNTPYGSGRALVLWGRTGEVSVDRSGAWLRTGAGTVALAAEPAADLYDDFVRACRGEGPAVPGGEDGLAALAVVLAAYASEATATFVRPSGGRNRAPGNESSDQVRVPNR